MLRRPNSAVFLGASLDACALWRMYIPHLNLPGSSFFVFAAHPDFDVIAGHDAAIVQRCCTKPQLEFIRMVRSLGMKVIYDLDDNVWELPEYNPAHAPLTRLREGFKACIRMVDVVTVSTHRLAKVVRTHVKELINRAMGSEIPIVVAENQIDTRIFCEPTVDHERLIVGWAGSSSHVGDLLIIEEAIRNLAMAHPEATFQFRGCEPPESLGEIPNVNHKLWMPVAEYGSRMPRWGWSVALAPVTDHPFNASKSAIKAVEAAYCGIPCLMSWVEPYERFCSHDPELRWLLCAGRNNWEPKIRELIHDAARREEYGRRMNRVMRERYAFRRDREHEGWRAALEAA